jgi:hypothetical protein
MPVCPLNFFISTPVEMSSQVKSIPQWVSHAYRYWHRQKRTEACKPPTAENNAAREKNSAKKPQASTWGGRTQGHRVPPQGQRRRTPLTPPATAARPPNTSDRGHPTEGPHTGEERGRLHASSPQPGRAGETRNEPERRAEAKRRNNESSSQPLTPPATVCFGVARHCTRGSLAQRRQRMFYPPHHEKVVAMGERRDVGSVRFGSPCMTPKGQGGVLTHIFAAVLRGRASRVDAGWPPCETHWAPPPPDEAACCCPRNW